MAEYIDKSDTETVFREVRKRLYAKKKDYVAIEFLIIDQMLSVAEEIIHAIPAADVRPRFNAGVESVERKHGEWIRVTEELGESWMCSECMEEFIPHDGMEEFASYAHFCPNCGADMR